MRRVLILLVVVLIAGGGGFYWWYTQGTAATNELVLYGNVDLRQVDLAFNDSGRITDVLVDEGDVVKQGEVVARLDTSRLMPQLDQAKAQIAAETATVAKLEKGSRPEEIAQAQANVDAARADAVNASLTYNRLTTLSNSPSGGSAVTQSQLDAAKAAFEAATARQTAAEQTLALAIAGPREEDVAAAKAQLRAANAQLALLQQQLDDTDLAAPVAGIVRSRLMEPGEIANPQRPVLSIAVVDPKWVRAYVSEPDLTRVKPGMAVSVAVDGLSGQTLAGHVGFISPVAEFTPRSIQTEELRTSLVYEVRVLVDDPDNVLRLGMPATVRLDTTGTATASGEAKP